MRRVAIGMMIVLVGCGSGDDSGGDASTSLELVPALSEAFAARDAIVLSSDEAECVARAVVTEIGDDRLREVGVTVDDAGDVSTHAYTEDELDQIGRSIAGCRPDAYSAMFTTGGLLTEADAECVLGDLSDRTKRLTLATGFLFQQPPDEIGIEVFGAMSACGIDLLGS